MQGIDVFGVVLFKYCLFFICVVLNPHSIFIPGDEKYSLRFLCVS